MTTSLECRICVTGDESNVFCEYFEICPAENILLSLPILVQAGGVEW